MVACAPADSWRGQSKLATVLRAEQARRGDDQPYRVFRHPVWMPPQWSEAASADRLTEAVRWDHHTLWPKHNLSAAVAMAEVQGTMKPYDYQVLLWVAKRNSSPPGGLLSPVWAELDPVGAKYLILPGDDRMTNMEPVELDRTVAEGLEDVSLWHNPRHLPRAWIVHRVEVLPPTESRDPLEVWRRTKQVFYPGGRPRDLRQSAVVEAAVKLDQDRGDADDESCRVVRYDPLRVEIEAELNRPGLVVLCDQFYPGWQLEVDTEGEGRRRAPILRTNRVMRGVWLPAGRHRLEYRYRPARLFWGAWLSGLGWITLGTMAIGSVLRRRPTPRLPGPSTSG